MDTHALVLTVALVGVVIMVASLLSGLIERSGVPQVAIFLLLGLIAGPAGLGLLDFGLDSPTLRVIATLGLVLVLFTDAIAMDVGALRQQRRLSMLVLGPGTLLPAAALAIAARFLLGLPWAAAAILGAALASTDPVLLRGLVRHPALPAPARLALRLESGTNDVVLLPVVMLAMLALRAGSDAGAAAPASGGVGRDLVGLFVLGPGLGVLVGWIAITALETIRTRIGVRRDYESIYALGVALTAYAAAEAAGGSGFLAAFAAGLVIAAVDVELCDCFLDYGEATAEMFLLLTFVALGASVIWMGLPEATDWRALVFAALALVVRTAILFPVMRRSGMDARSLRVFAWLGPRGLSSLLLVLLPVFAGVPGSARLFAVTCLVVLLSLVLHGGAIALFLRRAAGAAGPADAAPAPVAAPGAPPVEVAPAPPAVHALARAVSHGSAANGRGAAPADAAVPERLTLDELRAIEARGEPLVVVDVRTERAYGADPRRAEGALRVSPDEAVRAAERLRLPRDATIALFCA